MDTPDKINSIKRWLGASSINIFGPPYAGKDTHGRLLAKQLGAALLGSGDILRSSRMPSSVRVLHRTGKLFPSDVFFQAVLPHLKQSKLAGRPLILSSVGRRQGEEVSILEAAGAAGHPIKAAVYLKVSDRVVWGRWEHSDSRKNRGEREDDSMEALKVRLSEFRDKTLPVIEFYRSQGLLIEINSDQSKDAVSRDIIDCLFELSKS